MDERAGCAEVSELLPDLAAGLAIDDDPTRALPHLDGCPDCRHEFESLTTVTDELLALVRAISPPPGFEASVLARVATTPQQARPGPGGRGTPGVPGNAGRTYPVHRRGGGRRRYGVAKDRH